MKTIKLALSLLILTVSVSTKATETIRLTAIDSYAPTALWVRVFINYYMPEVDRRLAESGNYRIEWNKAFGGTIAKTRGVLEAIQYDLADIGIVTTPYHPDKVPFYNIPFVTPLVTADIGLVARTVSELVDKYPVLSQAWNKYDQIYLITAGSINTYQIYMADEIKSLEEFRGTKIGGVGLNLRYLESVDATGVTSGLSDWYNNLATGLIEGVLSWTEASVAYKLYEVAPYMLDVKLGAVTSKVVTVNRGTWNRLPEEVKTILQETARDYRDELARVTEQLAQESTIEYVEQGGQIIPLTTAQRKQWADGLPNMAKAWADDMEDKGFPGHQILKDYMDIMRANNQPIVRHWDRE
jgi:TRAP-type C4-dicarboxylate transport system substrate-binding protein